MTCKPEAESDVDVVKQLSTPNGTQFWMENAIPGVTDTVHGGKRYLREGPESRTLD
jgi:hypothetical protein